MHRTASLSLALLVSCAPSRTFWRTERAATQREAGSVHLAVLAVAPWSYYSAALQPDFRLDADQALREVARDTSSSVEQSTQAVGLGASVAQAPDGDGAAARETLIGTRSGGYIEIPDTVRNDAMLEYWAATSLYQEVQLLNRSIRDTAIPSGYRAYVVRLQITLLPRRRNAPYDAYTTVSFFSPPPAAQADGAEAALAGAPDAIVTTLRSGSEGASAAGNGPCVLPLAATDNLEGSLATRSHQDLRSLSLAFLGFPGEFATNFAAELFQQQLQAQVAGRDLNALLTVGRIADNSLRIRIGAMQQASARHAMVPRNHYVTVLVMVPEDGLPAIDVVARTVLVDTETGEELAGTSPEHSRALLQDLAQQHAALGLAQGDVRALLERVQANDQAGFRARLAAVQGEAPAALAHELWIDLVSLVVGSQFSASRFELPGHGQVDIPSDEFFVQTLLLVDDGGESALVIHGGTFGEKADVSAQLHMEVEGREITLAPDGIERRERELRLAFPSLAMLGLVDGAHEDLALTLRWSGDEAVFDVLYVQRRERGPAGPQMPPGPPGGQ